jgi:uncharacterized protein YjbI with pentapeptide repeats
MTVRFSAELLERFIARGISEFTSADIPDMSDHDSQSSHWVANHFLNSIGRAGYQLPMGAHVQQYLRRAEAAFAEHDRAREATLWFLEAGNRSPTSYWKALLHWEYFLGQSWQAYELLQHGTRQALDRADGAGDSHQETPATSNDVVAAVRALGRFAKRAGHPDPTQVRYNLHGIHLTYVDLSNDSLVAANLGSVDFTGTGLSHADLTEARLIAAHIAGAYLGDAILAGANLNTAYLAGTCLRRANLTRADLGYAHLTNADLTRANLSGGDLTDANLTDANLTDADLTRANLSGGDLGGANLTDANLTRANLTRANLTRANLTRANLTRANLTGADLTDANLTHGNLSSADLFEANLTDADLTRADLTHANLIDADLTRANLTGANLSGAYLTGADLNAARSDRSTVWPEDFSPSSASGAVLRSQGGADDGGDHP